MVAFAGATNAPTVAVTSGAPMAPNVVRAEAPMEIEVDPLDKVVQRAKALKQEDPRLSRGVSVIVRQVSGVTISDAGAGSSASVEANPLVASSSAGAREAIDQYPEVKIEEPAEARVEGASSEVILPD